MNVYYLSTQDGHRFFYYDASESPSPPSGGGASKSAGLWGWAEWKWSTVRKAMDEPNGGVARWIGRLWNWLHSFSHPDEALLIQLGAANEVVLHYPASHQVERVQKAWKRYLRHRGESHVFWMVANALVVPFGVLLAVLPGPNVIGFWFLYRAIYHLLAVRGVRRAHKGAVPTHWRAEESLDTPVSHGEDRDPSHEALAEGVRLSDYLHWSKPANTKSTTQHDDPHADAG